MPNWCENHLKLTGTQKDVSNFLSDFWDKKENCFSMQHMIKSNNYKEDFGTKWDISCDEDLEEYTEKMSISYDGSIYMAYETAWAPNENFIEKISSKYPNVVFTLEYYECGCRFVGTSTYDKGIKTSFKYLDREIASEIDYYSLVFELDFDDKDYILSECDLDQETIDFFNKQEIEEEKKEPPEIIDLTEDFLEFYLFPDPE